MKTKAPVAILTALAIANSTLPAFAATSPHVPEVTVTQSYASLRSSPFFARYTGSSSSIVTALNSLGINSSYSYRSKIAAANGISGYRGTSSQNLRMLSMLKQGCLKNPDSSSSSPVNSGGCFPRYTGSSSSIANALASLGIDSSYGYRAQIAAANGISGYRGSSSQNLTMLSLLKQGTLKKPGSSTPSDPPSGSTLSVANKARENGILHSSSEGERSASQLNKVIDQYYVDSNSRYAKKGSSTYCNIFVWDVTRALNAEIPHWLKNNRPATSRTSGAHEINANGTVNWLRDCGENYGWYKTSAKDAQSRANDGYPTVAIWKNPNGHGHVAIVRPEGSGYYYSSETGPVIAQAGSVCVGRTTVYSGFGGRLSNVECFTHD